MNRISATRLCRLIGGWSQGDVPLPELLSAAIGRLIADKELPVGGILPSERSLAAALSVSRGTVAGAYSKMREIGVLDSRHGSGSRITTTPDLLSAGRHSVHTRLTGEEIVLTPHIDMSSGALEPSPVLRDVLRSISSRQLDEMAAGHGYHSAGLPQLRWAVARYYGDLGIEAHSDNVLITNGAQQALWLLSNALLDPGDPVIVEDPTYRGALEALRRRDVRIVPVPVGPAGIEIDALEAALQRWRPKLVYLFAEAQNPTGISMSEESRAALMALLDRHGTFLIEDGSQNELAIEAGRVPSPLRLECGPERVATIGTLSKLFWGGLRIGWILASKSTIKRLISIKAASDLGSSVLDQNIATQLLERVPEARRFRQAELSRHLDVVEKIIGNRSTTWSWRRPAGGSALWIRIPGIDAATVCQQAQRRQWLLSAGPGYSVNENFRDYIRLPFVRSPDILRSAVETIELLA
jgi:DNA-binding transcriptional MocR family regulator